jgi:membrane associated rhomboid family serine protease
MALVVLNVIVFVYSLTLSNSTPASRSEALREFEEQTVGSCYGFQTRPTELDRFFCERSFQAREWLDVVTGNVAFANVNETEVLFSIITAMFMHAGWLHIIGNMLFLWVFGDNVEDRLGHIAYLFFYLAGGIFATLCQAFVDTNSVVPNVGASGAVAAVLGAYLVLFPRATITVIIPFFVLIFVPLPIPAVVMIVLWFLQNLLAGVASISETTADQGVAFFAHVGGFLFGFLLALLVIRPALKQPPRWAPDED